MFMVTTLGISVTAVGLIQRPPESIALIVSWTALAKTFAVRRGTHWSPTSQPIAFSVLPSACVKP